MLLNPVLAGYGHKAGLASWLKRDYLDIETLLQADTAVGFVKQYASMGRFSIRWPEPSLPMDGDTLGRET